MKQHTRAKIATVLCVMLLCVSALGTTAYAATVVVIDLADIVDETAPSVVEVFTETKQVSQFFHEYVTEGAGSGVILTADGYIVTNHHVVDGAGTIKVRLNDGQTYTAELTGTDAKTDSLIDASQLNLSDMGTMGGMGGGFGGRPNGSLGGFPNIREAQSGDLANAAPNLADDVSIERNRFMQRNGERPEMPEGMPMSGNFGGVPDDAASRPPFRNPFDGPMEEPTQSGTSNIVLLSVSVAVLLLGLAFAFKVKRRKAL